MAVETGINDKFENFGVKVENVNTEAVVVDAVRAWLKASLNLFVL